MVQKKSKEEMSMEKIEYTKIKDYNIPNLAMEKEKIPNGKYARMRLKFLRENKKAYYSILLMDKSLNEELMRVQEQATEMINKIIEEAKGVKIDIEEDGNVCIYEVEGQDAKKALKMIEEITREIEAGEIYDGKV